MKKDLCIIFFILSVITHIFSLGKVDDDYIKNYLNSLENVEIIQINNKEDFTPVTNNIFSFNYEENNPNYSIIVEKYEVKKIIEMYKLDNCSFIEYNDCLYVFKNKKLLVYSLLSYQLIKSETFTYSEGFLSKTQGNLILYDDEKSRFLLFDLEEFQVVKELQLKSNFYIYDLSLWNDWNKSSIITINGQKKDRSIIEIDLSSGTIKKLLDLSPIYYESGGTFYSGATKLCVINDNTAIFSVHTEICEYICKYNK